MYELQKQAEKSLFFPVSRKVQINFIFPDIYCVYTTTSCMQNITKRKKKTLDICIKFPMECLHRSPNLTCLLCITLHKTQDASRGINQRFIHHLYIGRKCTDCSVKSYTKCITEHIDSFCFIHLGLPSLVTTRQIPFLRLEGEQHIHRRFADWLYHMMGPHKERIKVTNTSCWNQRCVIRD